MFRFLAALLLAFALLPAFGAELPLDRIRLPPGFDISLHARVPGARSLALGDKGTLFVGTRGDKVYAVSDGRLYTLASGLRSPNGVAFKDGALFVAEISRVLRFDDIEARLAAPPRPEVVSEAFPGDTHHGWKFIAFGPDGRLYVPVGAPCNICAPDPDRYAVITRLDVASGKTGVVARGVRNTVGFDWHPATGELWFTDNGRDWLGDDAPPDELNRLAKPGQHFGYPHCHGRAIADPEFGKGRRCADFVPPVQELGAHVASLGMRFYSGKQFPARYRNAVFIAEHGSWTAARKPATGSAWCASTATARWATSPSSPAGSRANPPGAGRPTCW